MVVVVALAMAATSCGSRLSSEQLAANDEFASGGGGRTAASGGAGSSGTGGADMFGSLELPCGPGDASKNPAGGDTGVTKDELRIGTISDPGGPKPGLNQGVFDTMEAFTQWCNDLGGINGRKLKLDLLDGKILEYQQRVQAACAQDFALVGGIGVLDNLGTQTQLDCGLPNVPAAPVTPEQAGADLTWSALPNPQNIYLAAPAEWVHRTFGDEVARNAGRSWSNLSITEVQSQRLAEAFEARGFTWTYAKASNVNETNWAPIVTGMKSQGVKFFNLSSSFEELIPLLRQMSAQDFSPIIELEANYYNQKFPEQAGNDAKNVYVHLSTWPVEEADRNPATKQYLEIMKRYQPDGVIELLGIQSFSSALLWATAVKKLGANVTRDGLGAELSKITTWTGGGLHAPTNPGGKMPAPCFLEMKVTPQGYERAYPKEDTDAAAYNNDVAKGYDCLPPDRAFVPLKLKDYASLGLKRK